MLLIMYSMYSHFTFLLLQSAGSFINFSPEKSSPPTCSAVNHVPKEESAVSMEIMSRDNLACGRTRRAKWNFSKHFRLRLGSEWAERLDWMQNYSKCRLTFAEATWWRIFFKRLSKSDQHHSQQQSSPSHADCRWESHVVPPCTFHVGFVLLWVRLAPSSEQHRWWGVEHVLFNSWNKQQTTEHQRRERAKHGISISACFCALCELNELPISVCFISDLYFFSSHSSRCRLPVGWNHARRKYLLSLSRGSLARKQLADDTFGSEQTRFGGFSKLAAIHLRTTDSISKCSRHLWDESKNTFWMEIRFFFSIAFSSVCSWKSLHKLSIVGTCFLKRSNWGFLEIKLRFTMIVLRVLWEPNVFSRV